MASNANGGTAGVRVPWRFLGWGGAVALLLLPLIAMQFTHEVNWTLSDFIFAGVIVAIVGGTFELAVRASGNWAYRAAVALALAGLVADGQTIISDAWQIERGYDAFTDKLTRLGGKLCHA